MKRIHNTSVSKLDLNREYVQKTYMIKPSGLYWAIDDEWMEWCSSEMPEWAHKHNFDLEIDETSIYHIFDEETLLAFEKEYGFREGAPMVWLCINWEAVALDYKGVEITNYGKIKFSKGIMSTWFYAWDVSGGCVWDLSAVKSCKRINFQNA